MNSIAQQGDNTQLSIEEIKILQDIIKRMADNSFKLKGWTVTLVVVEMIFKSNVQNLFLCFIPLIVFSILDAYYLMLERKFRKVYDEKIKFFQGCSVNTENMFNFQFERSCWDLVVAMCSCSVWLFYGGVAVLIYLAWQIM